MQKNNFFESKGPFALRELFLDHKINSDIKIHDIKTIIYAKYGLNDDLNLGDMEGDEISVDTDDGLEQVDLDYVLID